MSGREFIDTNVLVYADDARDRRKQARARELIRRLMRERRGVLSLQILQEFFAATTRKLGMSSKEAKQRVSLYSRFDVVTLTPTDLLAAIDLHRMHHLSIWDSLVIRAALNGACTVLHTEDMQAGYMIEDVLLTDPFAADSQTR
ncbi:MAG: PIN domain-containing protein [Desulfurellaceae bacterium]|nr:PIN domain-containing protein [Desulfurellaceae bacterium]